jgi:2'-5' RNA ligase
VVAELDAAAFQSELADVAAALRPFPIEFPAVGGFPTSEGVVFLAPVPSLDLLAVQRRVHDRVAARGAQPYLHCLPEHWLPHCTIAKQLRRRQAVSAFRHGLTALQPLSGRVEAIGVVEFTPLQELYEFTLGTPHAAGP